MFWPMEVRPLQHVVQRPSQNLWTNPNMTSRHDMVPSNHHLVYKIPDVYFPSVSHRALAFPIADTVWHCTNVLEDPVLISWVSFYPPPAFVLVALVVFMLRFLLLKMIWYMIYGYIWRFLKMGVQYLQIIYNPTILLKLMVTWGFPTKKKHMGY